MNYLCGELILMLNKIKQYWTYLLEGLVALLTLAFLFEKAKRNTAEAQVAEEETQKQVQEVQKKVDVNDAELKAEEEKRKEIEQEGKDAKSSSSDSTDFLNKR